jgi:C4-type Zn-finger protein
MSKTLTRASDGRFVRPQNKVGRMETNRRCLDSRVDLLKVTSFDLKVRIITGLKVSIEIANFEVSIVIPSFKIKLDITTIEISDISTLEGFIRIPLLHSKLYWTDHWEREDTATTRSEDGKKNKSGGELHDDCKLD